MCEGEGTRGPWRRGATACCRLSRQLLARYVWTVWSSCRVDPLLVHLTVVQQCVSPFAGTQEDLLDGEPRFQLQYFPLFRASDYRRILENGFCDVCTANSISGRIDSRCSAQALLSAVADVFHLHHHHFGHIKIMKHNTSVQNTGFLDNEVDFAGSG